MSLAALAGCAQVAARPATPPVGAVARESTTIDDDDDAATEFFEESLIEGLADDFPVVVLDRRPSERVLRADYEPPETLVIVYEPDWRDSIRQIASAARDQAEVIVLVLPEDRGRYTVSQLRKEPHVRVLETRLDSPWVRDYGPVQTYELDGGVVWLDYAYGWDRPKDDAVPQTLRDLVPELYGVSLEGESTALDGGAVISNGAGLCAITEVSLTDANLDGFDNGALQGFFRKLGCPTTAILPEIPDETTGHADVVVQFLGPTVAAVSAVDPRADVQLSEVLDEAAERLSEAAQLGGHPLDIVRLPMEVEGEAFYSYVNSTRLRSKLLVPDFDRVSQHTQRLAYASLKAALPDVELVPIPADLMAERGGAVHCVTLGLGPARTEPTQLARPGGRPKTRG